MTRILIKAHGSWVLLLALAGCSRANSRGSVDESSPFNATIRIHSEVVYSDCFTADFIRWTGSSPTSDWEDTRVLRQGENKVTLDPGRYQLHVAPVYGGIHNLGSSIEFVIETESRAAPVIDVDVRHFSAICVVGVFDDSSSPSEWWFDVQEVTSEVDPDSATQTFRGEDWKRISRDTPIRMDPIKPGTFLIRARLHPKHGSVLAKSVCTIAEGELKYVYLKIPR